jgi:hypothetical protein
MENVEEVVLLLRQQLKIRDEELSQSKIREEELSRQLKIKDEQVSRLEFVHKIHGINGKKFSSRAEMLQEIATANFADDGSSSSSSNDRVSSTVDICKSSNSSVTNDNVIHMSKFKSSQLRNAEDEMNIFQLQLNIVDLAKDCFNSLNLGIDWESFLKQEADIVVSIRSALTWIENKTPSMDESLLQQVFIYYCEDFLQNINKDLQIYGVNGIALETDVEVVNSKGSKCKAKLKGKADVAIGDPKLFPLNVEKLLRNTSVIGELKKSHGSLLSAVGISSNTSQQLAEMLGISGMLQSRKLNYSFLKSFLTDFFLIRLAFRWEDKGKSKYFISSLFETPEEFVSCLVFIISVHSASDITQYVDKAISLEAVEDDNYVHDGVSDSNDISCQRNLQFDIENIVPPDTKQNDSEQYGSKRNNIIYMDEYDRLEKKRLYVDRLEKFDAARFGFLCLSAENLRNL